MRAEAWNIAAPFFYLEATMGLNIKNPTVERIARQLAAETGAAT